VERASEVFHLGLTQPTMQSLLQKPYHLIGSAYVAIKRGQLEEAKAFVLEAREFVESRSMRHMYPEVILACGRMDAASGAMDSALKEFSNAEALGLEMKMRPVIWQARLEASNVLARQGRIEEATENRRAAQLMIDEIAERIQDREERFKYLRNVRKQLESNAIPAK
jgi:hypothetical protein